MADIVTTNRRMLELTPEEPFGIIDQGALESAQQRPCTHRYYEQTDDIFTLAAVLGEGLVQNHCFLNANKRTAAECVYVFLLLNGWELTAPGHEVVTIYEGVATHEYTAEELADWLAGWSREFDTSALND
nr:type II toxin-antitoxin system death-on-curing family toxin [Halomonas sp. 1513]